MQPKKQKTDQLFVEQSRAYIRLLFICDVLQRKKSIFDSFAKLVKKKTELSFLFQLSV